MTAKKTKKALSDKDSASTEGSSLRLYLNDINRFPLMSKEEEEKVARLACQGDMEAKQKLTNANLRFVISVAKKFQGKGLPLEDLISEGNMGLLKAVDHFKVEMGYRFITYAVWWIRQSIINAIKEKGRLIRIPSTRVKDYSATSNSSALSERLATTSKKAMPLMWVNQDILSLDEPAVKHEGFGTIKDLIEDEKSKAPFELAMNSKLKDELENVIETLGNRAADIIRSRYGLGDKGYQTLKEIGERYDLSRERVRQIEKRALSQLQKSVKTKKLESYIV